MKIGILTQPLVANYGGILQNYALQTVLKRMGHELWTIDYSKFTWFDWFDNVWRVCAHKLLGHDAKFSMTPPVRKTIERPLRRFAYNNITLTTPRTKYAEKRIIDKYAFEAIVVGSDQIWRPRYNSHIDKMFLSFCKNMPLKRIAYAASFGTDEWELTDGQTKICAPLAQLFDAISVREASGVGLCRNHLNVEATHVLDPTLLLTSDDYIRLCKDVPCKEPFIFAYILDQSEEKLKMIKDLSDSKGLPYLIQSADSGVSDDDSIELWLSRFRDAAYIITDSFHGTAFSINFGKDFIVYGNKRRGNSRFESLLGLFDLQDRIIEEGEFCNDEIDWTHVNRILAEERQRCILWLKEAINHFV